MRYQIIRTFTGLVSIFVALTAIGAGVAILGGMDDYPLEWLEGTPFNDYTIPALILAAVVGGSAFVAVIADLTGRCWMYGALSFAGVMLSGYIVVEILMLNQIPSAPAFIEILYFVLGAWMFVGGMVLHVMEQRPLSVVK